MLRRIHCGQLAQWLLLWRSLRHPGYDAAAVLADMRALNVTPHIAQNISGRRSAVDGRTTRHAGYAVSQRKRKRIEEPFG
jgi:hypothetical protein